MDFFTLHSSATLITESLYFSGKSGGSLISIVISTGSPVSLSNSVF